MKLLNVQDSKYPSYTDIHANNKGLSLTVYVSVFVHTPFLILFTNKLHHAVAGESSKAQLVWMIVAIFTIVLAII